MITDLLTEEQIMEVDILSDNMLVKNKDWRKGQAFFNALHTLFPDAANEVRGTKYDPFYVDEKLESCIKFITN